MKLRLAAIIVVLLVLLSAVYGGWRYWAITRGPLPEVDGTLAVAGLREPVEIFRDGYGIPHIYAKNYHDLLFAQGYVHAQDRWWNMEVYRKIASGRMTEIAGKGDAVLANDLLMRAMNLRGAAEKDYEALTEEERGYYEAFADGVNAYILSRDPDELAMEYGVLAIDGVDIPIEPWTVLDSLAFGKLMGYTFSGRDIQDERTRAALLERVGPEMYKEYFPSYPYDEQPMALGRDVLPQLDGYADDDYKMPDVAAPPESTAQLPRYFDALIWPPIDDASNAWAVAPERTTTGGALFASDPHQGIDLPNLWYEIGLHCEPHGDKPGFDLYGYCAPPVPFVQAGHNAYIAWGLTNVSGSNALDLYRLRVNPENRLQYEWDGEWRDMTEREEVFQFGGADESRTVTIRETHLGPVITDIEEAMGESQDEPLAVRWDGLEAGTIPKSPMRLAEAKNFEDFREALRYWDHPASSIPYADVEGNIGFQMTGKFPIRPEGQHGLTPTPGWSSEYEWKGFIPYDLLPSGLNPESGFIAAANNASMPEAYYAYIRESVGEPGDYTITPNPNHGYRAGRITELLEASIEHDVDSMKVAQFDVIVPDLEELVAALNEIEFEDDTLTELAAWLENWDYSFTIDSSHALLFAHFWEYLAGNTYNDELGGEGHAQVNMVNLTSLRELLNKPESGWWDDAATETVETRNDIVRKSFREAHARVTEVFGADRDGWSWGQAHKSHFVNMVLGNSGVDAIEKMVNRGPYPTRGAAATVNIARWSSKTDGFENRHIPAYRRIIDMADMSRSVAVNSTGQSGHPFSPHYDDQMAPWLKGEYHPILWTREQVEAGAEHKLKLQPE